MARDHPFVKEVLGTSSDTVRLVTLSRIQTKPGIQSKKPVIVPVLSRGTTKHLIELRPPLSMGDLHRVGRTAPIRGLGGKRQFKAPSRSFEL
eukprot:4324319-Amphidinium_carterae.1